jgi:hypothetical protein
VRVHARGHGSERAEARDHLVALRVRHDARKPVEEDDRARAEAVDRDRHDALAVRRRDGHAGVDRAVGAQRVEPLQLGFDLRGGPVAGAVQPERVAPPGLRIVDAVGVVLRDVAELGRRRR